MFFFVAGSTLEAPLLGGCLEALPAAYQVSRYSGNHQPSQGLKSSHHSVPVWQPKIHDSRRPGLCSAKAEVVSFQDPQPHLGIRSIKMHTCFAGNTKNLPHRSCDPVIEILSLAWSQTWYMAKLVMNCDIIVEVRKALGAKFVCASICTTVEKTGYTNDTHTPYAPSKRTFAVMCTFLYIYSRKTRFLSVHRGEVSTVGEQSCKNGYTQTDRQTDTETQTEFPGLRRNICAMAGLVITKFHGNTRDHLIGRPSYHKIKLSPRATPMKRA